MLLFGLTRGDSKTYLYVELETTFQPLAYRLCPIMNTSWWFSPGKEIWKSFLLFSFAARSSSYVYFYLNRMFLIWTSYSSCQSPAELWTQASKISLRSPRAANNKTKDINFAQHPMAHVVQNEIMLENKAGRLHSSFLDATRPVLRIWFQWMPF